MRGTDMKFRTELKASTFRDIRDWNYRHRHTIVRLLLGKRKVVKFRLPFGL
jgi:hypothetical protein